MSGLLVSVRSVAEAEAALEGGAALIDVKEPARGPLGRADPAVLAAVINTVGGRRPVSAALGELADAGPSSDSFPDALTYVKFGLAGLRRHNWRHMLRGAARGLTGPSLVLAAYADAERAQSPAVGEVIAFACERPWGGEVVVLLDTFAKDGKTLLDHLSPDRLSPMVRDCRRAGVRLALAGSLGAAEVRLLLPLAPDWFAVRGAACAGGDREGTVQAERVRVLADLLL